MGARHAVAALLSVGDELAGGESLDTNTRWLAARLSGLGVRVVEHATVRDEVDRIAGALERMARDAGLVVVTGGLGPTKDDLTREGLARVMGEALVEDAGLAAGLEAKLRERGRGLTDAQRVQAMRPASARAIENPVGTAPGLWGVVERGGSACDVVCLPGPPREMIPMFEGSVAGALETPGGAASVRLIHTSGIGESDVAERLGGLMERGRDPVVGTTASRGIVTCRVRSRAGDAGALAGLCDEVRARLGGFVFGEEGETLAGAVLALLRGRGERAVVCESCTGGLLGAMVTAEAGSSDAFDGGWITYSNAMKRSAVGVDAGVLEREGAVSAGVVSAMATGALERSGAAHALSISGVAGPGGGSAEKPVGTVWIGRASAGAVEARRFSIPGDRAQVRERSAVGALTMLRMALTGCGGEALLWERERVAW